jgi:hypothetical protein
MSEVVGEGDRSGRWTVRALALLAVLAAVYFAWPVWRAQFPLEIDRNESWNAFQVQRLLRGLPLYPDPDALIANNYPPLSFFLIASLSRLGLDPVQAGRLLSLIAVGVTALSVAACVRVLGGGRLAAAVAGLWLVATLARFYDKYVGMNDPNLPALALMVAALAWFLRQIARGRPAEPAILLMVVAGFYKHTLIVTPAAALIWLFMQNRRLGVRAAIVGITAALAGLLLCVAIFGCDFAAQMLLPRAYSLWGSVGGLGQLPWIAPALLVCAVWWWFNREETAARFAWLYVSIAFLVHLVEKAGDGVDINAQFELVAATAIGVGLVFEWIEAIPWVRRLGPDRGRALLLGLLVARLLFSSRLESYLTLVSPDFRAGFARNAQVMALEVERMRGIPDPVVCSSPVVCQRAGKAFVIDEFAVGQRVKTGRLSAAELKAREQALGARFVRVDDRVSIRVLYRRF